VFEKLLRQGVIVRPVPATHARSPALTIGLREETSASLRAEERAGA